MSVGGSLRGQSGAITARAIKDSGIPALTTPDGEVKAYVSQVKYALDLIHLANDTGNPRISPNIIEIDSQAVYLVARDLSEKTLVYRHRRHHLSFAISCYLDKLITMKLVFSGIMTADALTKLYGPLEHWKRIAFLMGESSCLASLRNTVINRYRKDKLQSSLLPSINTSSTSHNATTIPTTIPHTRLLPFTTPHLNLTPRD